MRLSRIAVGTALTLLVMVLGTLWYGSRESGRPGFDTPSPAPITAARPASPAPAPRPLPPQPSANTLDPGISRLSQELHLPGNPPQRDLEILSLLVNEYSRAFDGNPVGDNQDITAALTGDPRGPGRFLATGRGAVRGGQLVDRWGTPYWFHPNSRAQMEIRSAGPDKELFTGDDLVHGESPAGLGATPTVPETGTAP